MRATMRWVWTAAAIGLLCCGASAPPAAAQTPLAWKLTPGQTFLVELNQRTETDTQFSGKPQRVSVETTIEQLWTVESADADGAAELTQEFRRIFAKVDPPQSGSLVYDSAATKKPTGDAKRLSDSLGPLVGGKLRVKLTARGELVDLRLDADLAAKLEQVVADGPWKQTFSAEGLRRLARRSSAVLPPGPVEVGATWSVDSEFDLPLGKIRQTGEHRYAGPERRDERPLELIEVTNRLEVVADPKADASAVGLKIKEQSQTGRIWFDAAAGRLAESQSTQRIRAEAPLRGTVASILMQSSLRVRMSLIAKP